MTNAGPNHSSSRMHSSTIPLRETLVRLNICRERDFRRCRRRVRRFARGIPAFDFVWIDALLSVGVLTPFQAKVLESAPPEMLRVGPCVLLERLGSGEFSETFAARTAGGSDPVALKRVRPAADCVNHVFERLQNVTERLRGLECPFVAGPHFAERHGSELIVLSRHTLGPSCRELLIRRGRFPVDVVSQIARQLACGLASLESRDVLHGQIQLANVRLSPEGQAVLVDASVSEALERGIRLRDDVPPEFYDGTAPELIGTGHSRSAASELYAFGCLLWELLAGRPPFPTGDPLAKLAAHQSRNVPDIQEFTPDTPPPLADAIRTLTEHDPRQRPRSFQEVTGRFGAANPAGERRLIQFRRQFDSAAPLLRPAKERRSRPSVAAAFVVLLLLAAGGLLLTDTNLRNCLASVRWMKRFQSARVTEEPVAIARPSDDRHHRAPVGPAAKLLPLPKPDADGVVVLDAGPYDASRLSYVGDLSIRGKKLAGSQIVVGDRPLEAVCRKFTMNNVNVSRDVAGDLEGDRGDDGPLLVLRSQEVAIDRCRFSTAQPAPTNRRSRHAVPDGAARSSAAVVWSEVEARDPDAGRIRLANSVFFNPGPGLICKSPPGPLEADNCLKVGGALFELPNWPTQRELLVAARHVTLRRAETLCRVVFSRNANRKPAVHAVLEECVFDLFGSRAALIQAKDARKSGSFVVTGNGSVIRPNIPIAASINDSSSPLTAPDPLSAVVEGLSAGEFQFVGAGGQSPRDSMVDGRSLQIPRQSDATPGIVANRLPSAKAALPALQWAEKPRGQEPLAN
jgi:eukaryotic-like serine/threonine-protein kinase